MARMTIKDHILSYMWEGGTITPLNAFDLFGTMKLNARLTELRKEGYDIQDSWIKLPNGKRIKAHSLHREDK